MHLFFIGLPGAGKSTAAAATAARWNWPWIDLDQRIEEEQGTSITELFARWGESAFREMERAALLALSDLPVPHAIACGGGTPLSEENRRFMQTHGLVVWLDPSDEVLVDRLRQDKGSRPLFAGVDWRQGGRERVAALRKAREGAYAFADVRGSELSGLHDRLDAWALSSR